MVSLGMRSLVRRSIGIRLLSHAVPRKTVSIVGSGPSGFYTAYHLLSKASVPLHVTMWERLPVPFGLSRYGVAPDHPEVKNCEDTFTECAERYLSGDKTEDNPLGHKFDFIGGVSVGDEVTLKQLRESQDAVVLSYGCGGDKKLGIPHEDDTTGILTSREFVGWYNSHPDMQDDDRILNIDWSRVRNVGIIGNGNVALDIARVLLSNKIDEIWNGTDICPDALELLKEAPIENVKIIGRREFIHSKFTNKEFRELWELEKFGIQGKISKQYFSEDMFDFDANKGNTLYDRAFKRRVEMCSQYLRPFEQRTKKNYMKAEPAEPIGVQWELDYLKSPLIINRDENDNLKSLTLAVNEVVDNKVVPTDERVTYDLDLLITSLGYGGKPLREFDEMGISFHKSRGNVLNRNGAVLSTEGKPVPSLYATGWIRKGSQGVIASTMVDAFEVADLILKDIESKPAPTNPQADVTQLVKDKKHTTWADWQKLNGYEHLQGYPGAKPREKITSIEKMYNLLQFTL